MRVFPPLQPLCKEYVSALRNGSEVSASARVFLSICFSPRYLVQNDHADPLDQNARAERARAHSPVIAKVIEKDQGADRWLAEELRSLLEEWEERQLVERVGGSVASAAAVDAEEGGHGEGGTERTVEREVEETSLIAPLEADESSPPLSPRAQAMSQARPRKPLSPPLSPRPDTPEELERVEEEKERKIEKAAAEDSAAESFACFDEELREEWAGHSSVVQGKFKDLDKWAEEVENAGEGDHGPGNAFAQAQDVAKATIAAKAREATEKARHNLQRFVQKLSATSVSAKQWLADAGVTEPLEAVVANFRLIGALVGKQPAFDLPGTAVPGLAHELFKVMLAVSARGDEDSAAAAGEERSAALAYFRCSFHVQFWRRVANIITEKRVGPPVWRVTAVGKLFGDFEATSFGGGASALGHVEPASSSFLSAEPLSPFQSAEPASSSSSSFLRAEPLSPFQSAEPASSSSSSFLRAEPLSPLQSAQSAELASNSTFLSAEPLRSSRFRGRGSPFRQNRNVQNVSEVHRSAGGVAEVPSSSFVQRLRTKAHPTADPRLYPEFRAFEVIVDNGFRSGQPDVLRRFFPRGWRVEGDRKNLIQLQNVEDLFQELAMGMGKSKLLLPLIAVLHLLRENAPPVELPPSSPLVAENSPNANFLAALLGNGAYIGNDYRWRREDRLVSDTFAEDRLGFLYLSTLGETLTQPHNLLPILVAPDALAPILGTDLRKFFAKFPGIPNWHSASDFGAGLLPTQPQVVMFSYSRAQHTWPRVGGSVGGDRLPATRLGRDFFVRATIHKEIVTATPSTIMAMQGMFLVDCEGILAAPATKAETALATRSKAETAVTTVGELARRLGEAADGLDFLSKRTAFTVDEMDEVLFALSQLNLPVGKRKPPSPAVIRTVMQLWLTLLNSGDKELGAVLARVAQNKQAIGTFPLSEENFNRKMAAALLSSQKTNTIQIVRWAVNRVQKAVFDQEAADEMIIKYDEMIVQTELYFTWKSPRPVAGSSGGPATEEVPAQLKAFYRTLEGLYKRAKATITQKKREADDADLAARSALEGAGDEAEHDDTVDPQVRENLELLDALDVLATVRLHLSGGMLFLILSTTTAGEHCGPSKLVEAYPLALPYACADTPRESSPTVRSTFMSPLETLSKTTLINLALPWTSGTTFSPFFRTE